MAEDILAEFIPTDKTKTIESLKARFMRSVCKTEDGHWIWTASKNAGGYGEFAIWPRLHKAHRVSYMIFVGPIPDEMFVLHKPAICKQRRDCVCPDHLYLGSRQDNANDSQTDGTVARGERNFNAKLNEAGILEIRRRRNQGDSAMALAREFGVDRSHIQRICSLEKWSHVK